MGLPSPFIVRATNDNYESDLGAKARPQQHLGRKHASAGSQGSATLRLCRPPNLVLALNEHSEGQGSRVISSDQRGCRGCLRDAGTFRPELQSSVARYLPCFFLPFLRLGRAVDPSTSPFCPSPVDSEAEGSGVVCSDVGVASGRPGAAGRARLWYLRRSVTFKESKRLRNDFDRVLKVRV